MGNKNKWVELYLGEIAAEALLWKHDDITGKQFVETVEKILEKLISKDNSFIIVDGEE